MTDTSGYQTELRFSEIALELNCHLKNAFALFSNKQQFKTVVFQMSAVLLFNLLVT